MFNKIIYLILLFALFVSVNAQRTARRNLDSPEQREAMREMYNREAQNYQFNRLEYYSGRSATGNKPDYSYTMVVDTMPKSITDIAKKSFVPDENLLLQNKTFLKLPNTGIVKMLPDTICQTADVERKKKISDVIKQCPHRFVNGYGKYFSFRQNDYVVSRFSDIGIYKDWIFSLGLFNQGVLVNIGDIPLDQVSLSTKGADFLNAIKPSTNIAEIEKNYHEFEKGIANENLLYQQVLPLELNKTYVLRVTAYNLDLIQMQDTSIGKIKTYPLKADKRKDILVAFRIIDRDDEGNTTLIWKELQSKNAPKLEVPK